MVDTRRCNTPPNLKSDAFIPLSDCVECPDECDLEVSLNVFLRSFRICSILINGGDGSEGGGF